MWLTPTFADRVKHSDRRLNVARSTSLHSWLVKKRMPPTPTSHSTPSPRRTCGGREPAPAARMNLPFHPREVYAHDAAPLRLRQHRSDYDRKAAVSNRQKPFRNDFTGILPLPPEVLVLWNAFLFQQGLDCCPFLPGLALDLFDLFACKHVSLY